MSARAFFSGRKCSFSVLCFGAAFFLGACGSGEAAQQKPATDASGLSGFKQDDESRCDYRGRSDRMSRETASSGSAILNVRRVYGIVGTGESRQRVLLCREVDTNLDGAKDLVRTYDDQGEKLTEQADTNYDGRIDTWITFANGRVSKLEVDKNHDGRVDETRYYVGGRVSRIQRDTNGDGRADVFEVYDNGRLERMGIDADHDGRVDRWDRDEIRAHEQAEREARELEEQKRKAEQERAAEEADSEGEP
jgi:hypothetical protein